MNKYTEYYNVEFTDCDQYNHLKPQTLLSWCSELAGNHLAARGITREQMWQDGQVFLLTRASTYYYNTPGYKQKLNLTTWEGGTKGIHFIRRFALCSDSGELLSELETMWVLVNPTTHKILRPSEYKYQILLNNEQTKAVADKFKCTAEKLTDEYTFKHSDIDLNSHVNNGVYLRLALDCLPDNMTAQKLKSWDINFIRENRQGMTIKLYSSINDNQAEIVGISEDKVSFEMKLEFQNQ